MKMTPGLFEYLSKKTLSGYQRYLNNGTPTFGFSLRWTGKKTT